MKKISLTLAFLVSLYSFSFSNEFPSELGVRFGQTSAIFYKKYINYTDALRPMLSFRNEGVQLTLLAEFHQPTDIGGVEGFSWYWGVGAHLGYQRINKCIEGPDFPDPVFFDCRERTRLDLGADGLVGIDYQFPKAPFILALEYKPYVNIFGDGFMDFHLGDFAFNISYQF